MPTCLGRILIFYELKPSPRLLENYVYFRLKSNLSALLHIFYGFQVLRATVQLTLKARPLVTKTHLDIGVVLFTT